MRLRNKHNNEIFNKNLEKYALYDPTVSIKVEMFDSDKYEFCYTHLGELNLLKRFDDNIVYYHDNDGAISEAKQWHRSVPFNDYNCIFLYGLGLGYYYDVAKSWLEQNPNKNLIILEDDICVLKKFLETEKATEILSNKQVIIQFLTYYDLHSLNSSLFLNLSHIIQGFVKEQVYLTTSKLYSKYNEGIALVLRDQLFNMSSWHIVRSGELAYAREKIFENFYSDTIRQSKSYDGNLLHNQFENIPAVICGAGPSIVNDIEYLKSIKNEAIIIASGTGMNVLNHYGIIPHFGTGLDPTDSQGTRIRTNYAYEVPFFYKTRFHFDSFKLLQGPKLLLAGNTGYSVSDWFTDELGLGESEIKDFRRGISSTNFAMEYARHLGCSPIILLGCDLAYTDASRYPPIISAHPTDAKSSKGEIARKSDVSLLGLGNDGKELITKIDWIAEAKSIRRFIKDNPEIKVISSTTGGLAINGLEYIPLPEVVEKYFTKGWDFRNWIHAETQKGSLNDSESMVQEKIAEWRESLVSCSKIYHEIQEEIKAEWEKCIQGNVLSAPPYNWKIALLESDLSTEPAFRYFITDITELVDDKAIREKIIYRCHSDEWTAQVKSIKRLEIDLNYITFYREQLQFQSNLVDKVIKCYNKERESISHICKDQVEYYSENKNSNDIYKVEDGRLTIYDEELDIDIDIKFAPQMLPEESKKSQQEGQYLSDLFVKFNGELEGQYLRYTKDGLLQYEKFYKKGKLHGPVTFYDPAGGVLAKSWFVDGMQQGKNWQYYPSGVVSSLQRYKEGVWHGKQEYYFENKILKSLLNYKEGTLDGSIVLYYENGQRKRELFFKDGKLNGIERYWDEHGTLIWEVEFVDGMPKGKACAWYSNGQLAREYTYYEDHKHYNLKEWNRKGKLILEDNNVTEDMKETAEKKLQELSKAISVFNRDIDSYKVMTKYEKQQLIF
ncbi:MAG: 6-hydroxymethylpterin diphosphokinase MptE-like protein [Chlamydiota bacterium]|nr:6-hydroxymethylpterin diphosphokinase MptE-like protein [Chlamydiota bacterium]